MAKNEEGLLECPFCGSEDVESWIQEPDKNLGISCNRCFVEVAWDDADNRRDLVDSWNTRNGTLA